MLILNASSSAQNTLRDRQRRHGPDQLDEILGTVVHELRSPLATVVLAVETMNDAFELDDGARGTLAIIARQSQQAMRLIEDLFDLAADASGRLTIHKEPVQLAAVVATAAETAAHVLAARRHRLALRLPAEPVLLEADPARLCQVFTNLLVNAAKFTDPGGSIELIAEADADHVRVRVRDSGVGIVAEDLPGLFDRFRRIGSDANRSSGGLGIGLPLVKALVELHGGSVSALSDGPGAGTEFIVRLPRAADSESIVRICPPSQ